MLGAQHTAADLQNRSEKRSVLSVLALARVTGGKITCGMERVGCSGPAHDG